jgi:hypothetical protein
MRKFSTKNAAVDEAFVGAEPIEFQVDDDMFVAAPPTATQFAFFVASQAESRPITEKMASIIDFFDALILEDEQRAVFRSRLLDRKDKLSLEVVQEILEALMEEWMDRPTGSASA